MTTYAAITGWGKCLPPAVLSNQDLAGMLETSDEWITSRTGIRERRISHVPMAELAHVAAERALACAGIAGRDIDYTVTCGTLVLKEESEKEGKAEADKARASVFFVARSMTR